MNHSTAELSDEAAGAPATAAAESTPPRTLMRVMALLQAMGEHADGMTLAELSQALKAPKSSLLGLLRPLVAEGYFEYQQGRYRLGPPVHRLARTILSGRRFTRVVRPHMEQLCETTGETVTLATLDLVSRRAVYIEVVESRHTIRYMVPPGTTRPLYAPTAGKVLLAFQDEAWVAQYLETEELKPITPDTVTDAQVLRENLESIRREGYAVGFGQTAQGSAGLSAPIFDSSGQIAGALMIGAPMDRLRVNLAEYRDALMATAQRVTLELGVFGTSASY